jgi:hypothetical protein
MTLGKGDRNIVEKETIFYFIRDNDPTVYVWGIGSHFQIPNGNIRQERLRNYLKSRNVVKNKESAIYEIKTKCVSNLSKIETVYGRSFLKNLGEGENIYHLLDLNSA